MKLKSGRRPKLQSSNVPATTSGWNSSLSVRGCGGGAARNARLNIGLCTFPQDQPILPPDKQMALSDPVPAPFEPAVRTDQNSAKPS